MRAAWARHVPLILRAVETPVEGDLREYTMEIQDVTGNGACEPLSTAERMFLMAIVKQVADQEKCVVTVTGKRRIALS